MDNIPQDIKDKIDILNKATVAYDAGHPIMEDSEWDKIYFDVQKWENDNNIYIENSPTHYIHFETVSKLAKLELDHPMMSLAKTKSLEEIKEFCGDKDCIAMLKMDGLSCTLHYRNGQLVKAATRGNGFVGEDITHNALVVKSIPKYISYKDPLDVDGEIICTYKDFEPFSKEYKNPRNFAAGSIRLLNSQESYHRNLTFVAWDCFGAMNREYIKNKDGTELIKYEEKFKTLSNKLGFLYDLGFIITHFLFYSKDHLNDYIETLKYIAQEKLYPIDGIVFKYDDCAYYNSLGATAHHPNGAIAFKFADDLYETVLRNIEWSMGRTGTLTPIAIFDEVDTGDSVVTRASLHNISVMEELYKGPWHKRMKLNIFMANQIIPQVASVEKSDSLIAYELPIPRECPICGGATEIRKINDSKELICTNPNCEGKLINKLDHFCGKKGLDIRGLSKATLEKLIDWGWVNSFQDIFTLSLHSEEWKKKGGFGQKSVDNVLAAIETAKDCTLDKFISAIGIPLIGNNVAKELIKHIETYEELRQLVNEHFSFYKWEGFADAKTDSLLNFDYTEADEVYPYLRIKENIKQNDNILKDKTFVITGSLKSFKNRSELKDLIERYGGKVTGSISSKTSYLINNDIESTSSKNKSAKELGIPIISEEEFMQMFDF